MAEPGEDDRLSEQWRLDEDVSAPATGAEAEATGPEELDGLLGAEGHPDGEVELTGVQALINSALVSYERLPMLEIVFDRLVRLATTSLRNFTSDNVELSMTSISSVRFGDYLNAIPLPAVIGVVKADEWDNFGLMTVDSSLIYSMIDVLLGGRRSGSVVRVEGRPYTTIELAIARRLVEVVLEDMHRAFEPVTEVSFRLERLETNPRFAAISRPANAAILIELNIEMEERGGRIEILLPYATIEPIRDLLLQMYMGEKFGRDPIWEGHLATEIYQAEVELEAVLHEFEMPLGQVLAMAPGQTVMFERSPSQPVMVRCGDVALTEGIMGHIGRHISLRVVSPLNPPRVTMASFEAIDERKA